MTFQASLKLVVICGIIFALMETSSAVGPLQNVYCRSDYNVAGGVAVCDTLYCPTLSKCTGTKGANYVQMHDCSFPDELGALRKVGTKNCYQYNTLPGQFTCEDERGKIFYCPHAKQPHIYCRDCYKP
ncbi:hypothetical protein DFH28DRAFT_973285 [Melampsora americana]|nr:hypothetical protein DFH28DRAFT_976538 [Melampsora americana]KAH9813892.1 hypothetical protein DFH28DRAFT_973285 [Melampsora americana]